MAIAKLPNARYQNGSCVRNICGETDSGIMYFRHDATTFLPGLMPGMNAKYTACNLIHLSWKLGLFVRKINLPLQT